MRLKSVAVKNFRCYAQEVSVEFDDLTTFVGRNDVGKSRIHEALEIFFNDSVVSFEKGNACIHIGQDNVEITCEFIDLPPALTLDSGAETTLQEEFLLTGTGSLKIRKIFNCSNKKPTAEIFVIAHHPAAAGFQNPLELKKKELQTRVKELGLQISLKGNPRMRKAIWAASADLQLTETLLPVSKAKEDTKRIWDQIESWLLMFALFRATEAAEIPTMKYKAR